MPPSARHLLSKPRIMDSETVTGDHCPERTDAAMDEDWLTQEFKEAEREYGELPEWARPVVIPPAAGDSGQDVATATRQAPEGTESKPPT